MAGSSLSFGSLFLVKTREWSSSFLFQNPGSSQRLSRGGDSAYPHSWGNCLRNVSWTTIVPFLSIWSNLLSYFLSKKTKSNTVLLMEETWWIHSSLSIAMVSKKDRVGTPPSQLCLGSMAPLQWRGLRFGSGTGDGKWDRKTAGYWDIVQGSVTEQSNNASVIICMFQNFDVYILSLNSSRTVWKRTGRYWPPFTDKETEAVSSVILPWCGNTLVLLIATSSPWSK